MSAARRRRVLLGLALALPVAMLGAASAGSVPLPFFGVLASLLHGTGLGAGAPLPPPSETILWVVLYNLIMFALAEAPIAGYLFAPEQTRDRVEAFNQWLGGHGRQIAIVLCGMAGAVLVVRGLVAAL